MIVVASAIEDEPVIFQVMLVIAWAGLTGATLWAIIVSAKLPPPVTIVVSLSSLVLMTVAAYIFTEQQELATLAGLGLGALAGAVSATWAKSKDDDKDD